MSEPPDAPTLHDTARHALVFWSVAAGVVALVALIHAVAAILLLTFGGLMFGTCLRGLAEWFSRRARTSVGAGIAVVLVLSTAALVLVLGWVAPHVRQQAGDLVTELGRALDDLRARVGDGRLGELLAVEPAQIAGWLERHALTAGTFVLDVLGTLGSILYVAFVALYFAAAPALYRRGVLAFVPGAHRAAASRICDDLGRVLRRWMLARLVSMVALGIGSWIALWCLGIPLALSLGLLAGVLLFVPYIGSIASAVPAMLIALTVSPWHVLYVAIVYVVIHIVDSYVLAPALFKRAVEVPPLLVLTSQLVAGALWGMLGLVFATPIVACALVVANAVLRQ